MKAESNPPGQKSLLRRIREAKLPQDAKNFQWEEIKNAGLLSAFGPRSDLDEPHYRLIVLFALQTRELRKKIASLEVNIESLEDYHSPLWAKVSNEVCPIKQMEFRREAVEDQKREIIRRQNQPNLVVELIAAGKRLPRRPWKSRDKRKRHYTFEAILWHQPMTALEYHEATGLSRRTVQNILQRTKARQVSGRTRRNDPSRYDQQANLFVLVYWLTKYEKNREKRKAKLTRTLLRCERETPEHYQSLLEAMSPVIASLKIRDKDFQSYVEKCRVILYPPQPEPLELSPSNPFSSFIALLLNGQ